MALAYLSHLMLGGSSKVEVAALKVQTKCLSQFKYSFALCSLY
jgi:hypothetical protein